MDLKRRRFLKGAVTVLSLNALVPMLGIGRSGRPVKIKLGGLEATPDLEKIKNCLAQKRPNIWVFTGDSITHGAKHTHGYRSYPEIFQERIRWELGRVRDIVINSGISGNTAAQIRDDFDWRIGQFKPTVVSVMVGTNDCERSGMSPEVFKDNISELIGQIRDLGAIPVLHTPNPIIIRISPERKTLPEYIPVLRALSAEEKIILIDNYEHWEKKMEEKSERKVFKKWLNDRLHPNQYGHQEIARLIFRQFGVFDPAAPTCGGTYYEGEH
jgi:lysophospholipase L1-like esterase